MRNLAIICYTTELVRDLGLCLFLVWCHRLICIALSLCKHACKEVCDVNPEIDPYPFLARSCDRWWPDFVTFTAFKRSRFGLKRGKKAQCVSNSYKDLFKRKKYFGVRCTLSKRRRRRRKQLCTCIINLCTFFAVIWKTITWNDLVLRRLWNLDDEKISW